MNVRSTEIIGSSEKSNQALGRSTDQDQAEGQGAVVGGGERQRQGPEECKIEGTEGWREKKRGRTGTFGSFMSRRPRGDVSERCMRTLNRKTVNQPYKEVHRSSFYSPNRFVSRIFSFCQFSPKYTRNNLIKLWIKLWIPNAYSPTSKTSQAPTAGSSRGHLPRTRVRAARNPPPQARQP